jgi:hypothetical protein
MQKGEMNIDPIQGEFFARADLSDNLVRESVQNSLDAACSEKIRVRFAISLGTSSLRPAVAQLYMSGLWTHLKSVLAKDVPKASEPMDFLVIEDFGTRGLQGDPKQAYDTEQPTPKNDFYYFWRNIGRSPKGEMELGRWGVGKAVFAESSRINGFFGLTIRNDDHQELLMGQCVLKMHTIGFSWHRPYGFYANHDKDGFPMPLQNRELQERFRRDFHLKRRNEPGLSIVVPYFRKEDLTLKGLERAVIEHYFYPVISKRLVLEFEEV